MNRQVFSWLIAVFLLISVVVEPLGAHAQAEPPGGTIPALQPEKLQQVQIPERLQIIADATGKSMGELSSMTDDALVDLIDQYKQQLNVASVQRVVTQDATPEIDAAKELADHQQRVLSYTVAGSLYLPLLKGGSGGEPPWQAPTLPVSVAALKERYQAAAVIARSLVPAHLNSIPEKLCPSETAGTPVWYRENSDGKVYIVGHNDGDNDFTSISNVVIAESFELQTITFTNGLVVWADRFYGSDTTKYQITVREYSGSSNITLMYYTAVVLQNVKGASLPYVAEFTLPEGQFTPTARSPMRHACEMLALEAAQRGDYIEAYNSALMLKSAGFRTGSVYGEMWGQIPPSLDFIFTTDAYRNCYIGIDGTRTPSQYWGINGAGAPTYQYESKVCLSPEAYILASELDPLGLTQFAIAVINTTGNPDAKVEWPGPTPGETTPRNILRYVESKFWNGYGVSKLTGPADVGSGIRTFVFGEAEVLLCYDHHDNTSCDYVKKIASVVTQISFGMPPFAKDEVQTEDWGTIRRPYAQGAPLVMWRKSSGLHAASVDQVELFLPDKSTIEKVLDECCGMAQEVEGVIPLNTETTYSFVQFMLTWLSRLEPSFTVGKPWIPLDRWIPLQSGETWLGIPAETYETLATVREWTEANQVCQQIRGQVTCSPPAADTITPSLGYRFVGGIRPLRYLGTAVSEDARTVCDLGPAGPSFCAFPGRPYPYTMLTASNLRSIAAGQGCADVTITRRMGNGTEQTYPGTDFQILKEVGYKVTSSRDCSLTFGQ